MQFSAEVLPSDATNKDITWSVMNGTGSGTITQGGLLTSTSAGTLNVVATAEDGSGVTGSMQITITEQTTYINNPSENGFFIYPNPGKDFFYIQNPGLRIRQVKVFNINGSEVFNYLPGSGESILAINLSSCSGGLYLCRLFYEQYSEERRILILP